MAYFNSLFIYFKNVFYNDNFFFENIIKNYTSPCYVFNDNIFLIKLVDNIICNKNDCESDLFYMDFIKNNVSIFDDFVLFLPKDMAKYEYFY